MLNALLFDIRKLLVRKRVDRRIAAIREKMEQSAAAGEVRLPAGHARARARTEREIERDADTHRRSGHACAVSFGANIPCDLHSDGIS